MSTLLERRRAANFRAKAQPEPAHFYGGIRNTWSEPLHYCECGFESHEKAEVMEHVGACGAQPDLSAGSIQLPLNEFLAVKTETR